MLNELDGQGTQDKVDEEDAYINHNT